MILRGDIGGLDMIDYRQGHHHRDRQSRPDDVDAAKEAVLPQQMPRLLNIKLVFIHNIYYLFNS